MTEQTTVQPEPPSDEYANFKKGLKHLISVPKAELDRREAEWRKQQDAKKKNQK